MSGNVSVDAFDAVVVGSGAAGGWAAKALAETGKSVLVLEAGPERAFSPPRGFELSRMARRLAERATGRRRLQSNHLAFWGSDPALWVNEREERYTTPPDHPFTWIRGRQLGGRSLLWGGLMLRLSEHELHPAAHDGFGVDWPIGYDDLAPYYDEVETAHRVWGTREGLPQLPDGCYVGHRPLTYAEEKLKAAVEAGADGRRVIPCRGIDGSLPPDPGRAWTRLTSIGSSLADARASGRVTIRTNAVVSHVLLGPSGNEANGAAYVERESGIRHEVRARLVVLCASTISTVRILLHTASRYPQSGLASLPALGRYLMDHVCYAAIVRVPGVPYQPPQPHTGAHGMIVPRFQNLDRHNAPFRGGFGIWGTIQREGVSGRKGSTTAMGFLVGHGDMAPRAENFVSLGTARDRWGLPVPHIDCSHGENDKKLQDGIRAAIDDCVGAAGGRTDRLFRLLDFPGPWQFAARIERYWRSPPPGAYAHEVGGARMGTDPQKSVVDAENRCWAVPNLLVTDGACWPTSGWQSPTLTIMAITLRACRAAARSL